MSDMQTYAMSVSACLKFAPLGKGLRVSRNLWNASVEVSIDECALGLALNVRSRAPIVWFRWLKATIFVASW
jgi:hypothetical protein